MMQKPEELLLNDERGQQHNQSDTNEEDKHTPFDEDLELWIVASSI